METRKNELRLKNFNNEVISENNTLNKREKRMSAPRPRSLTTLKLEIISERARKIQRIKEAVDNNSYSISTSEVARSLMKHFNEEDIKG
jgi:anti-sigma28 factor (negative regulator of flagellin synthesis)